MTWHMAILAFALLWGLQVAGTAFQMRHYRATLRRIRETWSDGYVGCGAARSVLGAGCIAVVVTAPDSMVRQVLIMRGRTVFARFRPILGFVGSSLAALRSEKDEPGRRPSVAAAINAAIEQVDRARAGLTALPSAA